MNAYRTFITSLREHAPGVYAWDGGDAQGISGMIPMESRVLKKVV